MDDELALLVVYLMAAAAVVILLVDSGLRVLAYWRGTRERNED